ncbi:MAG: hypothetical protein IT181_04765 [Acidobacteria bacterium]|nr:hypothetical protein [Acidobacteriota bacterium]
MRRLAAALVLVSTASLGLAGQTTVDRTRVPRDLPPRDEPAPGLMCVAPDPEGRIRKMALEPGLALSFRQEPSWITPSGNEAVRLRRFIVAGDIERVRFDRWDGAANAYVEETWTRDRSDTVAGRIVSIFEPSWPADVIAQRLTTARVGLDEPSLFLGYYRGAADQPAVSHAINLRVASGAIGPVEVVRVDDTVQYASHVVNLVLPSFGDGRLNDALELAAVTRRFYDVFDDVYDVIAIVPEDAHVDDNGAFHQRVRNDIAGLGLPGFNQSAAYGSQGRLRGVEFFHNTRFASTFTSSHELAHTWGHNFDWTRIAGVTRAGHQPVSHAPLMTGGESVVSGVLTAARRIAIRDNGDAVVERAPVPAGHHPLDLYAMGLLEPAALPDFTLFEEQGQFSATTVSTPAPGAAVTGGRKTVTINDVMAAHGARSGPVLTDLRRATVIVSRDGLLSAQDLARWNFFAARHEDAAGSGMIGYDGLGSFDASTGRRVDLSTGIQPTGVGAPPRTQNPEPAQFGALDCRGFEFTTPPPTRVRAGQRFTIAGRVAARDRSDFSQAMFRFWPSDDVSDRAERAYTDVSRSGLFSVDVEIRPGREGQYTVEGFLFWPDAAPQYSRCRLSVVNVTP